MELKLILEAILFSAQKPLSLKELRDVFAAAAEYADGDETVRALKKVKESELTAALEQLAKDQADAQRSYRLACVAGSWQFVTQPEYAPWVIALVGLKARPPRLSQPALETLAIIAYRQPVTRGDIEEIRGVAVKHRAPLPRTPQSRGVARPGAPRPVGSIPASPFVIGSEASSAPYAPGARGLAEASAMLAARRGP